jgi:hypothetical protein
MGGDTGALYFVKIPWEIPCTPRKANGRLENLIPLGEFAIVPKDPRIPETGEGAG